MTALDLGAIAIVLIFLVRGIWVGFVRQLASLAGLVLGFFIAGRYYEKFSPVLASFIASPQIRFLITYTLLFLAVFLVVIAMGFVLKKVMTISLMDWFDRLLGGIFGLGKAFFLVTVAFMLLSSVLDGSNPVLSKSFSAHYLRQSAGFFRSYITDQDLKSRLLPREPAISLPVLAVPAGKTPGAGAGKIAK
ncbi:CvpA family protein [Thiovibrio sp. JS02]